MKQLKLFLYACIVSCFIASLSYAGLEPSTQLAYQTKNIPGIGKVYEMATMQGSIYLANQPTESGLQELKKLNIKTFITLCPKDQAPFDEKVIVKKLGAHYVHIPLTINDLTLDTLKAFNDAIQSAKHYPIFIHGKTVNEAAMMMALNNITEYQAPVAIAIDEAKHYGLSDPKLIQFIQDTVKKYNLEKK